MKKKKHSGYKSTITEEDYKKKVKAAKELFSKEDYKGKIVNG